MEAADVRQNPRQLVKGTMSPRPHLITQADVARAIRAAKREGASALEVRPDGTLLIHLEAPSTADRPAPIEPTKEIVL